MEGKRVKEEGREDGGLEGRALEGIKIYIHLNLAISFFFSAKFSRLLFQERRNRCASGENL